MINIIISISLGLIGGVIIGILLTYYLVSKEIRLIEKENGIHYAKSND